jgi:hypothetical protein
MRCPHCREKLLQKSGTQTKLRAGGPVVFDDEGCSVRCFWCKSDVRLPVRLSWPEQDKSRDSFVVRVRK